MIHHDQTPFFLERSEAQQGERVRLRVRAFVKLKSIFLVMLKTGEIHRVPMQAINTGGPHTDYEAELELFAPVVRYLFWCETDSDAVLHTEPDTIMLSELGTSHTMPSLRNWFQFVADWHRPNWLDDRVFYQIFPDRFKNGDPTNDPQAGEWNYHDQPIIQKTFSDLPNPKTGPLEFFGGDLLGIEQALDYLEDLGVNGLYLTPIFDSPSSHRYDTRDYMCIDPHLGGELALRSLLDATKKRDMRFILDGVFNHTGNEFASFQKALAGESEKELFSIYDDGSYESFFGVKTLPKINFATELAHQTFLENENAPLRYWLRFGTDGWRLDVAHMMGANGTDAGNTEIHRRLRFAARKENPEAWIFGERFWDAEPYLQAANPALGTLGAGEDGVMNYQGFALPFTDWLSGKTIFGSAIKLSGTEMSERILEVWRCTPHPARMSHYNLLGSHDVPRILERLGGDAMQQATAFAALLAFPGVPGIYYGDEIGMMGGPDPMNRAPFLWDANRWNTNLFKTIKTLIAARKKSNELQRGSLAWLHASEDVIAFARPFTDQTGNTKAAILLASRKTGLQTLRLKLQAAGLLAGNWTDAISGQEFSGADGLLTLNFECFRLLLPN